MENMNLLEYMNQATALMGQEKYEAAITFFEKAEAEDRFNIDVYIAKGVAYANLNEFEKARTEFEKALKVNKKEGVVYFHLGNIEMLLGNKAKGIELYNNAIANGFDDAQVYFSLGLMHEEEGNDDLAVRNYSKAILKDPNRADIRIRKIRLFIKNQHLQEALQALDELIISNPDVFEGYHLKYLVLANLEKFDEANAVLSSAMFMFPKDTAFAIDKASLMITREEYKQAIEYLNSIQDTYEVDEEAAHSIAMEEARAYAFLENMDETINSLERARNIALKYDPPRMDMEAIYLLMNCYLNNDILDKVVECARELKKANGEDYYSLAAYYYEPFALKKLGKQEEAKKLFEEAVTYFRSASLKNPGNVDCYAFRILSLRELGNCEKALELADYLVAVKDDLAEAHTLRATILEDLGREEEAKAERAKAVSIGGYMADLPANKQ